MRRAAVLCSVVLCAVLAAGADAAFQTEQATVTIYPGDNWIAAPIVPLDPDPASVFAPCISQCTLKRLDAPSQTEITYPSTAFPHLLLGDGYKMSNPTPSTYSCTYTGIADGVPDYDGTMTDMWVSLPGDQRDHLDAGGMHWIGHPFNHSVSITNCRITDGNVVRTIEECVTLGWIDGLWSYLDGQTQTVHTAGLASYGAYDTYLRPTHMYEIGTHRDNIALIVPAYPVPEPSSALVCIPCLVVIIRRFRR